MNNETETTKRLSDGGKVIRIGTVPSIDGVPSYFGLLLERGRKIYQLIPSSAEQAETLAMTAPGDSVRLVVAATDEGVVVAGPTIPVEFHNETLNDELRFPSMGSMPVSMRRRNFD